MAVVLLVVMNLVYVERRTSAFIQNRIGRTASARGLLQSPADVVKLFIQGRYCSGERNPVRSYTRAILSMRWRW